MFQIMLKIHFRRREWFHLNSYMNSIIFVLINHFWEKGRDMRKMIYTSYSKNWLNLKYGKKILSNERTHDSPKLQQGSTKMMNVIFHNVSFKLVKMITFLEPKLCLKSNSSYKDAKMNFNKEKSMNLKNSVL